jgi:hypothetical protein
MSNNDRGENRFPWSGENGRVDGVLQVHAMEIGQTEVCEFISQVSATIIQDDRTSMSIVTVKVLPSSLLWTTTKPSGLFDCLTYFFALVFPRIYTLIVSDALLPLGNFHCYYQNVTYQLK